MYELQWVRYAAKQRLELNNVWPKGLKESGKAWLKNDQIYEDFKVVGRKLDCEAIFTCLLAAISPRQRHFTW